MRVLLFTGTGGAGTTTTAAATAAVAAARGRKTLTLSTGPQLADALGASLGPEPAEVDTGLYGARLDGAPAAERRWDDLRPWVRAALARGDGEPVQAEELPALPGAAEVVALLELRAQVDSGRWDLVVVDAGPAPEALRLLALPDALRWYVDRVLPPHRRALGARPWSRRGEGPGAAADRFSRALAGVRGLLGAPGTSVRLVLTPEAASVAATRRTTTALALQGCAVDALVVNRVLPASGDAFLAGWAAAQAEQLAAVRREAGGLPVRVQPHRPAEPLGLAALTELGELLYGDDDPTAGPAAAAGTAGATTTTTTTAGAGPAPGRSAEDTALRVRRDGREFVLSLALPFAGRDLALARSGDELVVTLAGTRRLLALPSVLRRCRVVGAALADERTRTAELHVRFVPDLDLWPDALGEHL